MTQLYNFKFCVGVEVERLDAQTCGKVIVLPLQFPVTQHAGPSLKPRILTEQHLHRTVGNGIIIVISACSSTLVHPLLRTSQKKDTIDDSSENEP